MLINAHWLKKNFKNKNIKIIDASWYLPNVNRNPQKEYLNKRIPGATFFDIDEISDKKSNFPHMLPNKKLFEYKVSNLGIRAADKIIIYCKEGVLSSPRVWWMFKYFGHKQVFILNGGFRSWVLANGKIEYGKIKSKKNIYKIGRMLKYLNFDYEEIKKKQMQKESFYIIDARPKSRFLEIDPEPRKNIGKGKIEGSSSLEFTLLETNGYYKTKSTIRRIFKKIIKNNNQIICSCGSGISACSLAFSLSYIGNFRWSVYDGSWTEWYIKTKS